jgi:hypothetical protein
MMLMLMTMWILRIFGGRSDRVIHRSEHIVELDGGREGPLDRGKTTGETFLEVSSARPSSVPEFQIESCAFYPNAYTPELYPLDLT